MKCRQKMLLAHCPCRSRSINSALGLVWPRSDWDLQQQADYHLGCSDSRFGKHSCFLTEIHLPRQPFKTLNSPVSTERLRCTVCALQTAKLIAASVWERLQAFSSPSSCMELSGSWISFHRLLSSKHFCCNWWFYCFSWTLSFLLLYCCLFLVSSCDVLLQRMSLWAQVCLLMYII